jgi:hypothetical protein
MDNLQPHPTVARCISRSEVVCGANVQDKGQLPCILAPLKLDASVRLRMI